MPDIDKQNLPQHIAIIMDGNGRWAKKRHLPVVMGHRAGARTVDRVVTFCARIGIKVLTLYCFSTENWKRPQIEINALMQLLYQYLDKKFDKLNRNNVRLSAIGDLDELPEYIRNKLQDVIHKTSKNKGLILNLALNYGAREEIVQACKDISKKAKSGKINIDDIDEDIFSKALYTRGLPDPDLLIRTSGELRLSNFLLWQLSYAEIVVTKTLWPDFADEDLKKAILEFQDRDRRFGARL